VRGRPVISRASQAPHHDRTDVTHWSMPVLQDGAHSHDR
jgi:hypothetical protein